MIAFLPSFQHTQHATTKRRGDREINSEVRCRIDGDEEIGYFSDRAFTVVLVDVANAQDEREQSVREVAADEAANDDDQTDSQSIDGCASRRFHSRHEIGDACVQV